MKTPGDGGPVEKYVKTKCRKISDPRFLQGKPTDIALCAFEYENKSNFTRNFGRF